MKELVYHRLFVPALERWGDKEVMHDGEYHATLAQHGERVFRLAHGMRAHLGVKPGDRVAIMAANSHQFLELYHAGFLGACVVNPLNLRLAGKELQYILEDSGTEVVFVDPLFAEHFDRNLGDARDRLGIRHVVLMGEGDVPHDVAYEDVVAAGEPEVCPEPEEDDPVILMYTGGTTGLPKGVLLDHRAEMLNLYHVAMVIGMREDAVYLHQTPMFHAASMAAILGIPSNGASSVFIPMFEPGAVLDLIERYQVTQTVMVPTMIAMLLNHPGFTPERMESLKVLTYGASPMPTALLEKLLTTFPEMELSQGYGMTESSSVLTFLTHEDHAKGGDILGSAGRPVPGVVISIQDPTGKVLPPGQGLEGEVCARAGNLMREYWNKPDATAEAFRDGWYHTGDAGHLDANGYLYLVDRVKDMIVTGGENVYSIEVENAISSHPAVDQVAVIGIPHETWGEQVHAIVVLKPGTSASDELAEEIKAHARESVAGYKVPKSVEFRRDPIPLSGAMKPLKRELRKPYWEGQGRNVG
jgi:acyl-CoA synthetase (AMP-forming)/AMP-acid ligase II